MKVTFAPQPIWDQKPSGMCFFLLFFLLVVKLQSQVILMGEGEDEKGERRTQEDWERKLSKEEGREERRKVKRNGTECRMEQRVKVMAM